MACPTGMVAIIIGEFVWRVARVGVRLRLCRQRLRSRSSWLGAEVDGVDFFLCPAHSCRAVGSCPQDMPLSTVSCKRRDAWPKTCHVKKSSEPQPSQPITTSTTTAQAFCTSTRCPVS